MHIRTRRTFIRAALAGIIGMFLILWNKITLTHIELTKNKWSTFPLNKTIPVSFYGDFIISNTGNKLKVYSSKCTHLGCSIKKIEMDQLICPCHGSAFDLDGNPVKGPAFSKLKEVPFKVMDDGKSIKVQG